MLLTLANLKGGVAKTTSSVSLSLALAEEGRRVLLVDSDPQPSCMKWASIAGDAWPWDRITVVSWTNPKVLEKQIASTSGDYDDVIVDTPPSRTRGTRGLEAATMEAAVMATGNLLIPTSTSSHDLAEIADTFEIATALDAVREVYVSVLLIRVKRATKSFAAAREALANEFGYPVMNTWVPDRETIAQSLGKVPSISGPFGAYKDVLAEIRADQES